MAYKRTRRALFRPAKRARFMRRRASRFSRRRNYAASSQRGNTVFAGFRGRKMPYRRYIRNMYSSTTFKEHHRSFLTRTQDQNSTANPSQMQYVFYPMIADTFWANVGGSISDMTIDQDAFIRGGIVQMSIKNNHTETMNFRVFKVTTTDRGFPLGPNVQDFMWDPSSIFNFEENYRVKASYRFAVEPGDTNTLFHRLKPHKIEATTFNNGHRRDYWVVGIHDYAADTFGSASLNFGHNISFVADRY